MKNHILLSAALVATTLACKPQNDGPAQETAKVRSLDGLTGAKTEYVCGSTTIPDYAKPLQALIEPKDAPLTAELMSTAAALPAAVAQLMAGVRARIILVPDGVKACEGTPFTAEEKALNVSAEPTRACWRQTGGEPPELLIEADVAVIRTSLVRLGSYFFTEFLLPRLQNAQAPAPFNSPEWKNAASAVIAARTRLGEAFLEDLKGAPADTREKFVKLRDKDAVAFGNVVLAEAQDSYYCSKASRDVFRSKFEATWAVFADGGDPQSPMSLFGAR